MDIRLLRIFSAIAKHGALPAAGREIHLTASALSHGLKTLETELGVRLFDRTGRRLVLNQAGEQLLEQIQQPLAALEAAAANLKTLGQWGQARLRVGAPEEICRYVLPQVLYDLDRKNPKLLVRIETGDSSTLLQLLRQQRIDLAITFDLEQISDVVATPLFDDELLFAVSKDHRCVQTKTITAVELVSAPPLLWHRSSHTTPRLEQTFRRVRAKAAGHVEIGSVELIKELVKLGMGSALLPPWMFESELRDGSIVMRPWGPHALRRRWAVNSRLNTRLSWPEEQFVSLLRERVAALPRGRQATPSSSYDAEPTPNAA